VVLVAVIGLVIFLRRALWIPPMRWAARWRGRAAVLARSGANETPSASISGSLASSRSQSPDEPSASRPTSSRPRLQRWPVVLAEAAESSCETTSEATCT
jgi:hypothetical protein